MVDLIGLAAPLLIKAGIHKIEGQEAPIYIPDSLWLMPPSAFLFTLISIFISLAALGVIGRYYWRANMVWQVFPNIRAIRQKIFDHLVSLDWQALRSRKIGDLIAAISEDAENLRMTISFGTLAVMDTIICFILLPLVLLMIAPQLTILIFPPLVLIVIVMVIWSDRWSKLYEGIQDQQGELSAKAFDLASGLRVIKAFGRESAFEKDFHVESHKFFEKQKSVAAYQSGFGPFMRMALGLATVVSLIKGGSLVMSGELSLGAFAAFTLYLSQLDWPLTAMAWFVELYRSSRASKRRLMGALELRSELPQSIKDLGSPLEQVRVDWGQRNRSIILRRGERWALSGPVGSGKTLFLECLAKLRKRDGINIQVNGVPLDDLSADSWQGRCLFVPQEASIFSRSLRSNILLGKASKTDSEIWRVLESLKISQQQWEERGGLLSRIGERGLNLSGGQKQRISLARALVRDREIYLFDDVLSHLDPETEQRVLDELSRRLPQEAILVFASQRWSVLKHFDQHIVIEDLRQRELCTGSREEVLSRSRYLRGLRELQTA